MNKTIKIIVGVVIVIAIAWFTKTQFKNTIEDISVQDIEIGASLPLTGKGASFGENIKNGIDLAVKEVNDKYSFNMEVVYEDTQSETETAVSAVRKLIDIDKVNVVLGPARSSAVLAVAPIAEENKVIIFTPIASAEDISNAGDYIFRNRESSKSHGVGMAEFLKNKKNIQRVAMFTAKSANAVSYATFFKSRFEE